MKLEKSKVDYFILIFGAFIILVSKMLCKNLVKTPLNLPMQETAVNVNSSSLSILSAGNKRLISSYMWIQTLLDSDLDHYKKNDLNLIL